MPGLDLVTEDDLDFARVFAIRCEERAKDTIDREGDLGRKRADVVHYE